jgi:small subunit ribosomal protein S17e
MGRIKTAQVKRVSMELMRFHKDKFTKNFEENKKITEELLDVESKKLRNIVAGYLTRMITEGQEI